MNESGGVRDPRTRLRHVSEELIRAYRAACRHPESRDFLFTCSSCDQIAEIQDMLRCAADTIFEASALCAHFQQELAAHTLRGERMTPALGAPPS